MRKIKPDVSIAASAQNTINTLQLATSCPNWGRLGKVQQLRLRILDPQYTGY